MYGDFSRLTFDPKNGHSRVLMQQGRPFLDADWNEQVAILLHAVQTLARTVIGRHGGPQGSLQVGELLDVNNVAKKRDFQVAAGEYYVDGIHVALDQAVAYSDQQHHLGPDLEDNKVYLAYLDLAEDHVSAVQNDAIREVALGGFDTATRARVSARVRVTDKNPTGQPIAGNVNANTVNNDWDAWVASLLPPNHGMLKARAKLDPNADIEPCATSPESRYRGVENQLYRVEIHTGGPPSEATFKWSRDNGSVELLIRELSGLSATLEGLGRDARRAVNIDDWVEVLDDDYAKTGVGPLLQVGDVEAVNGRVELQPRDGLAVHQHDKNSKRHPLLRRWDHRAGDPVHGGLDLKDGAAKVVEGTGEDGWLTLEDGIQIQFQAGVANTEYRPGDYWLIPARIATGDVEWPGPQAAPEPRPPHGVQHHLAPLGILSVDGAGTVTFGADCRRVIAPVAT